MMTPSAGMMVPWNLQISMQSMVFSRSEPHIFDMNHVARDDLFSTDLDHCTIANDIGLQCQSFLEAINDIASMVLLDEPYNSVKEEKATDDAEINPVI